jgi:hypothetical protein
MSIFCMESMRSAGVAFSSTDFSLCAFRTVRRNSKPHRLKPVLLDLRRILVSNSD